MIGGMVSDCTHDDRSKSMNASAFSCVVSGPETHTPRESQACSGLASPAVT